MLGERLRKAAASVSVRAAVVALCVLLPAVSLYYVWQDAIVGAALPSDYSYYHPTAEALLDGESIYPEEIVFRDGFVLDYVYPPLTAIVVVPFTALPVHVASALFLTLLAVLLCVALALVGVRDWRCYGLAFTWPPVLDAVETGNVTIMVVLAAALVWRFRDRPLVAGASLGVGLGLKLLLWPLAVWLAATRRWLATAASVAASAVAVFGSWAVVAFDGLAGYPDLLRELTELMEPESYSVYALALDLGAPSTVARILWLALAVGLLAGVVHLARRGDEAAAFVLAIAAVLASSPIVWIHYFTFLLVAIAIVQPRLAPAWFVGLPMQLVVTTGAYNGSTFQTAAVLALAALAIALALRSAETRPDRVVTARPAAQSP